MCYLLLEDMIMKPLIKYSLVLLAAFSLGACGVNESIDTSSSSISTISVNSLPEGLGVGIDAFNAEANKITDYKIIKTETFNYEFHETLKGTWYRATDDEGNRLPDGTDIYADCQTTFNYENGKYASRTRTSRLPTNRMNTYAFSGQPENLKKWIDYRDSTKESYDQMSDYFTAYEEKFFVSPLRMFLKITTSKINGEYTTVDGAYSDVEEYDVSFREDGYIDTFVFKETVEVDGIVTLEKSSPEQVKCTYTILEKCTMQYTFE